VHSSIWPGPGCGIGSSSTRKLSNVGSPTGREARTIRWALSVIAISSAYALWWFVRQGSPARSDMLARSARRFPSVCRATCGARVAVLFVREHPSINAVWGCHSTA
jgi:hypothetical protein